MNAAREDGSNNNLHRSLGRLEGNVERLLEAGEKSDETSAHYRQEMRTSINELNDKIDPVVTRIDSLEMTVKAHEVVLASYATRESELRGAARLGRWLIHAFWMICTAVAVVFGDRIKFPFQKLLALFKG